MRIREVPCTFRAERKSCGLATSLFLAAQQEAIRANLIGITNASRTKRKF
jgi:hypothetical protein